MTVPSDISSPRSTPAGSSGTGTLAFYDRLGFRELSADDSTTWMGIAPGQLA
jgi:hypothetical protein